jgi:hypothetical protein
MWQKRLLSKMPSPERRPELARPRSAPDLYRPPSCETTKRFERVASIIGMYRLALARWEQAVDDPAIPHDQLVGRQGALEDAQHLMEALTDDFEKMTPSSRQLFLVSIHDMQRRGQDHYFTVICSHLTHVQQRLKMPRSAYSPTGGSLSLDSASLRRGWRQVTAYMVNTYI